MHKPPEGIQTERKPDDVLGLGPHVQSDLVRGGAGEQIHLLLGPELHIVGICDGQVQGVDVRFEGSVAAQGLFGQKRAQHAESIAILDARFKLCAAAWVS